MENGLIEYGIMKYRETCQKTSMTKNKQKKSKKTNTKLILSLIK